jgi:fructose-bisphosphate aldolase class II
MLITDRQAVLDIYAEAAARGWVIPCFCAENLTTLEAVLAAVKAHGEQVGRADLPVSVALTVNYPPRPQAQFYTQIRDASLGLRLFMVELRELTGSDSPFARLRVMVHLDHIQPVEDAALLSSDLSAYSSIMYDASHYSLEENIRMTRRFVAQWGDRIVIEGACDEIVDAGGGAVCRTTTADEAKHYADATGVDLVVANLGTEHRAGASDLTYQGEAARAIRDRIGARIVLHGCSSVPMDQIRHLCQDGICKVNIWTILERDATPALLEAMVREAACHTGAIRAVALHAQGYLGEAADRTSAPALARFTTSYRQGVIFEQMRAIALQFLQRWYS